MPLVPFDIVTVTGAVLVIIIIIIIIIVTAMCLQCFDAVGWAAGRASGL